ncbi:MAG: amidohydrolase family protein [Oligoflexia bacterium]|nr:amidohydrolase family protein [Oligoflexia bacterium]
MNTDFQNANLNFQKKSAPWMIVQKESGKIANLWTCKGADHEIIHIEGVQSCQQQYPELSKQFQDQQEIPEDTLFLPTGIDLQVHLRFPGQPTKEELLGGLESAIVGGYDTIVTMPNTNPYLDNPEELQKAVSSLKKLCPDHYPVKTYFTASGTKGMQGTLANNISSLKKAGAIAITDDGWGVKEESAMREIFRQCEENDILFQQHAEMPGHGGVASGSDFQKKFNLPEYPRTAESQMIARDIRILKDFPNARYHVLHVSTAESLKEIQKAKDAGLKVSAEVTPHHLFFCNEDIPDESNEISTSFKMNPPLFAKSDRDALRKALRDGLIDCVSTDHAPHEWKNKQNGWKQSPFGTRGMETALPALITLWKNGELSWSRLVEVFSMEARKLVSLQKKPSGWLFLSPDAYTLTPQMLPGISRNTCFLQQKLYGKLDLRAEPNGFWQA